MLESISMPLAISNFAEIICENLYKNSMEKKQEKKKMRFSEYKSKMILEGLAGRRAS
jgi:hypothetical protein